jgi:hypothetical protein
MHVKHAKLAPLIRKLQAELSISYPVPDSFNCMYGCQGRREVGGVPGQIFFKGPYLKKIFRKATSPRRPPPPVAKNCPVSMDFISFFYAKFQYLAQKNRYLVLCAEIFNTQKRLGPTNIFRGPPAPRGPGQFAPPSLRP